MTKREAKRLSILKWKAIINNNGGLTDVPETSDFPYGCAYCEKYLHSPGKVLEYCSKCPMILTTHRKGKYGCCQSKHPYMIWTKNENVKNAQAVLDLIRKS